MTEKYKLSQGTIVDWRVAHLHLMVSIANELDRIATALEKKKNVDLANFEVPLD